MGYYSVITRFPHLDRLERRIVEKNKNNFIARSSDFDPSNALIPLYHFVESAPLNLYPLVSVRRLSYSVMAGHTRWHERQFQFLRHYVFRNFAGYAQGLAR